MPYWLGQRQPYLNFHHVSQISGWMNHPTLLYMFLISCLVYIYVSFKVLVCIVSWIVCMLIAVLCILWSPYVYFL
jgi:hypothetical protein